MTTLAILSRKSKSAFSRAGEHIDAALASHFWSYAAVLLLLFLACSIAQDLRLKMWNEEIVTLYVSQQGTPIEIVKATKDGMDATPPLYPVIVSAIRPFVTQDALAVRLPSTLGFTVMLLFVLAFCRRRMPAADAFIAALLAALACGFYATEGRCYGLVLGCAAGALFSWQTITQRTPRIAWLIVLAVFLMLATALNYYSIFLLVPLAVGELVRWRQREKVDFAICAAMLPALATLTLHYPLIMAGTRYLSHFWTPGLASWRQIPDFYLQFSLLPAGVVLVAFLAHGMNSDSSGSPSAVRPPALPAHESAAIVTLALMPPLLIAISMYTTHIFLARYALWSVIGLAIAAAWLLWLGSAKQPGVGIAVLAILVSILAVEQWRGLRQEATLRQGESILHEVESVPDGPEPIVISFNHAFMELSYYAEPHMRDRLVYAQSRGLELYYTGSELDYVLLSARARRTQLRIVELDSFLRTNPRFLLVATAKDYLPRYLMMAGYHLVPIHSGDTCVLYEAEHGP